MTQESFDGIKSGASIGSVRVQEGAAVADYIIRKGVIEDRESDLAAENSRSFVVEDSQIGRATVKLALENIDSKAGEATLSIYERTGVSPALLQPVIQQVMREAGVHEAHLGISNAPDEELRRVGFQPVSSTSDTLAFAS
jgi:hypothetical protein